MPQAAAGVTNIGSSQITDGSIIDADINASAAIALSKLASDPLARANHTGTQLAATISDFNAAVATQIVNPFIVLKKTADQTKTSNNTMADDNTLTFSMAANTTYRIRANIFFTAKAASDIRVKFNGPAAPTNIAYRMHYGETVTGGAGTTIFQSNASAYTGNDTSITAASDFSGFVFWEATIVNGVNAGTFAFQWAQNTSVAENTVVLKGSTMEYFLVA